MVGAYKDSILADSFDNPDHVDYCWRILIGLGCVPGVIALYFRLTIPETPRFTMDIDRDVQRARTDIDNVLNHEGAGLGIYWVDEDAVVQHVQVPTRSRSDFVQYFGRWPNLQLLIGVAYSWFAVDVSFSMERVHGISHMCCTGCLLRPWSQLSENFNLVSPRPSRDW